MFIQKTWTGLGTFCCGLVLIVTATVLNLAHDRMTDKEISNLPLFLSDLYDMAGKLGVTLLLVALGLTVILLGVALRCDSLLLRGAKTRNEPASEPVYFYSTEEEQPVTAPGGAMVLQTTKYLQQRKDAKANRRNPAKK